MIIQGLPDKVVRVELKIDKMSQMHIPLDVVLGSIQSEGVNIPGGSVDDAIFLDGMRAVVGYILDMTDIKLEIQK